MRDPRQRKGNHVWLWKRFLSRNLLYLASFVLLSVSIFFYLKAESYRKTLPKAEASATETDS